MKLGVLFRRGVLGAAAAALIAAGTSLAPGTAKAGVDTMVIAIGALPQGIDLDKNVSPTTWSMGAQVLEDGMSW